MAYTRWGAIGEQAGAGLQSGLNAALQQQMKQRQISQFAKKYGFDEEKIAGAMLGLPAVGGAASLQDQILYNALKSQFPDLQMPTKSTDPYAYYRKQQTQNQPQMQEPQGQPSNNGVDAIIAADGNVSPKPYKPSSGIPSDATQLQDEAGNIFYQTANGELYDANGNKVEI